MRAECDKVLSVLLFAQIAPHCSSPSENPCSTEHQTYAALQTHVSICAASSKSAFTVTTSVTHAALSLFPSLYI